MKRLLIIVLAVIMLVGCSASRTAITVEEFIAKAEAAGYSVRDRMDEDHPDEALYYYDATKATGGPETIEFRQITFMIFTTDEYSKSVFKNQKTEYEKNKAEEYSIEEKTNDKFEYYYLTSDGKFSVVSRVENTIIFAWADEEFKTETSDFLKTIGY